MSDMAASQISALIQSNAELKTAVSDMQSKTIELEKEVAGLKDKLGKATQSVAFTADGEDGLARQGNGTLVFTRVVNNEGKGYDAATGIFTAPVAGTYSFTVSVTAAQAGGKVGARIWGDGGIDVELRGTDTSTGSGTATARLEAGGRLLVGTPCSADLFDGNFSSFSGVLTSPDIQ